MHLVSFMDVSGCHTVPEIPKMYVYDKTTYETANIKTQGEMDILTRGILFPNSCTEKKTRGRYSNLVHYASLILLVTTLVFVYGFWV